MARSAACRRACCRSPSGTRRASASTCGWRRSPTARARCWCCSPTRKRPNTAPRWPSRRHSPTRCSPASATPASTCACSATRDARELRRPRRRRCARRRRRRCASRPRFGVQTDKRATLELAIEHLLAQAPRARRRRSPCRRPARPFGAVRRRQRTPARCAWPASAPAPRARWLDNPDRAAAALHREELRAVRPVRDAPAPSTRSRSQPRLWLADEGKARKQPRVLNEVEPYRCIRCGKPFGTLRRSRR